MVSRLLSARAAIAAAFIAWLLLAASCVEETKTTVLTCSDADVNKTAAPPWILRIWPTSASAELVVHVPEESVRVGVPPGNRKGRMHATERAYEIVIPSDSGGRGDRAWTRMQMAFDIDRFTGRGTLEIGEPRHGETAKFLVQCRDDVQKEAF